MDVLVVSESVVTELLCSSVPINMESMYEQIGTYSTVSTFLTYNKPEHAETSLGNWCSG